MLKNLLCNKTSFVLIMFILLAANYIHNPYIHFLPGIALILGIIFASLSDDRNLLYASKTYATKIIGYAIVCVGCGFNIINILKAGASSIGIVTINITVIISLGLLLGYMLKTNQKVSLLVSCGTAICGGSAIAAIYPIIEAESEQIAIAMSSIFILNGIALILFPMIGHYFHLSQTQFGIFAALAIHDTSSVVGSCMAYGKLALFVGTVIKLVRALWIIPLCIIIALVYRRHKKQNMIKAKAPWFILWFIGASTFVTVIPQLQPLGLQIKHFGESLFVLALFCIGSSVSIKTIKTVGGGAIIQAISLWVIVSAMVLYILLNSNYLNFS